MTEKAVGLCDEVCNSGVVVSLETSLSLPVLRTWQSKGHVFLRLDPTEDEKTVLDLQGALDDGRLEDAESLLTKIRSRRLRARGSLDVAIRHRDLDRALERMLDALSEASRGGIHELIYVLHHGKQVLRRASPGKHLDLLLREGDLKELLAFKGPEAGHSPV
jgi:hypothetical protein